MNNNMSLTKSGRTNAATGEIKNNDAVGTPPPPPPPPRIKSKNTEKIITDPDGRKIKNGIEIIDTSAIQEEIYKLKHTEPRQRNSSENMHNQSKSINISTNTTMIDVIDTFKNKYDRLTNAIIERDAETVKNMIKQDPDLVTKRYEDELPPLFNAIAHNKGKYYEGAEIINLLIDAGGLQDNKSKFATEMLALAINRGYLELAELMVNTGVDLNPTRAKGLSPLIEAIREGYSDFAEALIKKGSDVNHTYLNGETALQQALISKNTNIVRFLVQNGLNINSTDKDGLSPLMKACMSESTDIAEVLIENGAQVDFQIGKNNTALMHAVENENIELIELLLKNTKNINLENNEGETALILAAQSGDSKIASLLIEAGASIDLLTSSGESALSVACEFDSGEILNIFIDKMGGIDRSNKDFLKHYPLENMIITDCSEALSVLMRRGLRIDHLDEKTWECLANASGYGHTKTIRILLNNFSSSLPLSKPGFFSRTPAKIYSLLNSGFRRAAKEGHEEIVRMLIGAGAQLDALNRNGESALTFAIENKHPKVLLFLIKQAGKLNHKKENGNVSDELLLAFDSAQPDPLTIDILLNFENDLAMKQGGLTYTVRFNELCNKVHNFLAAGRTGTIDKEVLRDLNISLCTDFDLSYLNASTLENTIQRVSTIYSPNSGTVVAPTAKQLRMSFVESIASDQRLHDLIRRDDHPAETHYAKYTEAPEMAEKLIRRASAQAGFIVLSAETELKKQQDALSGFLNNRAPAVTSNQISEFMQEEGWHPLLISLVVDSRNGLRQNQTSDRLFEAIRKNLDAAEFVEKIEQLPSYAARHLLTQQMNRLIAIINA
ncbi:Ankyrin repeats (many copies) [Oxalobacteraceae bacterium]